MCNLKRATTWDDLSREMAPEVIARFRRIYASVDDIDLFPGGLTERPVQGGLVGPTFACIIGLQFRQLKKCDRFWCVNIRPNVDSHLHYELYYLLILNNFLKYINHTKQKQN